MCAPPKIAVFVFVLTIHLAILAFAFPRLDLSDPAQSTAATSIAPGTTVQPASPTDARAIERLPSADTEAHTSPVQHHQHEAHDSEDHSDERNGEPAVARDLHQHSLADNTSPRPQLPESAPTANIETPVAKTDRVVTTLAAQAKASTSIAKDLPAEPDSSTKPGPKPVTLTNAAQATVSADAVSIPKPKPVAVATTTAKPQPQPNPVAVRRPATTDSSKAGSDRMSNLRPMKSSAR